MSGTTPNRSYPFPTDGDAINTAGHIESLARSVDSDTAGFVVQLANEAAVRSAADSNLTSLLTHGHLSGIDGTGNILIQGAFGEYTLDMFAVAVITWPVPFTTTPVVMANASNSTQSIALGVELVTPTKGHVFGRWLDDGEPTFFAICAFQYIAIGFGA